MHLLLAYYLKHNHAKQYFFPNPHNKVDFLTKFFRVSKCCINNEGTNGYVFGELCSQKASQGQNTENTNADKTTPLVNSTMVYEGALSQNGASPSSTLQSHVIAGIVSLAVAIWQMG